MRYLIDTDWIIDGIAGIPAVLNTLSRLSSDGVAVSIVTVGEVYEGAFVHSDSDDQLRAYRRFLSGFPVLHLTDSAMELFGRLRAQLRRQGNLIPDFDLLIATTAIENDLTLVTGNTHHFARILGLALYQRQ